MEKQEILQKLKRTFDTCLDYEKNPERIQYYTSFCYGMLKECVRSILHTEKVWKYDEHGDEMKDNFLDKTI